MVNNWTLRAGMVWCWELLFPANVSWVIPNLAFYVIWIVFGSRPAVKIFLLHAPKLKDQKFQAWWVRCRIPENVENFIIIPTFVRNKAWANRVFFIYDEKASKYRLSFCNLSPWTRSKTHKTSFWSSLCVAPNYYSITIDIKFNKTVSTFFLVGFILSSLEKTLLLFSLVTVPGSMFIVINFLDFLHLMTWVSR